MKKKEIPSALKQFVPLVDSLAQVMGPDCEVLLHDVSTPDSSVVACKNAHITGRKIGSPMTAFGLQLIKQDEFSQRDGVYNYIAKTNSGKRLKCNVMFIRNKKGKLVGMICLNLDITRIEMARNLLDEMLSIHTNESETILEGERIYKDMEEVSHERFYTDIDDVWINLLKNVKKNSPEPFSRLSPAEREIVIEKLNDEGFFMVKGAIDIFAKEINKSRFTIYAHLRRIREKKKGKK